ncbi:hypothetical protein [Roseobacter sp. A03A-229]
MAGTTQTTASEDTSGSKQAQITDLLSSGDWDQRVEAARARREQVLAEKSRAKTAGPAGPKIQPLAAVETPPPAPPDEPPKPPEAPDPTTLAKAPVPPFARTPPPLTTPKSEKPVLRAIRHQAVDSVRRAPSRPAAFAPDNTRRISGRTALLAIACCTALGFGLSFGFGTALSVGSRAPETLAEVEAPPAITPAQPSAGPVASETAELAPPAKTPDPAPAAPTLAPTEAEAIPAILPKIHVYAPDSVTTAALDQSTAQLGQSGFEVATVQRLSLTISAPHVRYYDATDAAVARTLAQDLQIEARDFTQSGNGAPGRVEVWLDGTTNRRSAWNRQANPVDELIRLGNRFIRSLQ